MMMHPAPVFLILLGVVSALRFLEARPIGRRLVGFLPVPFWCYALPMILSSLGCLPSRSPVYDFFTSRLLAACLFLLLLNLRLKSAARAGPAALGAMAAGAFGIAAGAIVSYAVFGSGLPSEMWRAFGALAGSWTGGSANMVAVKEALQAPEETFAPAVVVDALVTYSWMALLIALVPLQERWDRWVGAAPPDPEGGGSGFIETSRPEAGRSLRHGFWLVGGALLLGELCLGVAGFMPPAPSWGLTAAGWGFIIVTTLGIGLSLTPASRLERFGASRWGYTCLYLLLAAIGAKARIQFLAQTPLLLAAAALWVAVHAVVLGAYGRMKRIPLSLLATASQANFGGVASAPLVAGVYRPSLAPVGLLLALIGNAFGTYIGILVAQACRWVG